MDDDERPIEGFGTKKKTFEELLEEELRKEEERVSVFAFLVAPAAEQSDLSSLYGVCLHGWLVVCLLVDRELNFKY